MACEGRAVIVADPARAGEILRLVAKTPGGRGAALIGEVTGRRLEPGLPPVAVETGIGTKRFLPLLDGEPIPRIC
jgi:hydrogenase maturation factor